MNESQEQKVVEDVGHRAEDTYDHSKSMLDVKWMKDNIFNTKGGGLRFKLQSIQTKKTRA
jgi:hypothetical protein